MSIAAGENKVIPAPAPVPRSLIRTTLGGSNRALVSCLT